MNEHNLKSGEGHGAYLRVTQRGIDEDLTLKYC